MNYSQEEIEKKRLLALQRKQHAQTKSNFWDSTNNKNSILSSNSNIVINENKSTNVIKPFGNDKTKYVDLKAKFRNKFNNCNTNFNKQKERFNPITTQNFFGKKSQITGKCYMISDERFTLETSSYFTPLIETLKTIPSRSYDMKTKTWNFLLKDYETLMEKIINFKSDVQIVGLPRVILQIFRNNSSSEKAIDNIDLSDIDPHLVESLMPFQREGVCYGISKNGCCMIADDMGLGKTIQALGIAHYFRSNWPLLIVAPSSVRYQWAEAIYTFLPSVPAQYVHHYLSTKDFLDNDKIVITTYDLLVRAVDVFKRQKFGFVILDESHALKNVKTARFQAIQPLASRARHVVLLSGTPALSRPIELFSQINLIMPTFMGYQEYGIRYCAGEKIPFGWNFTGSSNMQELQLLLKHTCVIRRLKNDILNQLPKKKREVVILDAGLIKAGTKAMKEMSKKLKGTVLTGVERHSTLLQYYNESSIAKREAICDYISKLLKTKQKCIIFAHHQNVLDAICDVAESMNTKYIRIDGRINSERKKDQVDKFQSSNDYVAAVLSITTANAGITLTAAQLVIFAELFWNPGILCQAEDRAHRIGQDGNVVIRYLVAKRTVDDYLWPLIQKKMNVLNEVGLDQEFSFKDIDVTKQILYTKQTTLDFSGDYQRYEHKTDEDIVRCKENSGDTSLESFSSATADEFQELLEFNEEDFGDWDDMK
ncbi:SWI/SNF-related matrix-associated actin-dependent regulator of chromatin subfamily A-like protein 1 [Anthophora plagiata]